MTLTANLSELQSRARTARTLAEHLFAQNWGLRTLDDRDDAWWKAQAKGAGVRSPSQLTRDATALILRRLVAERVCPACMGDGPCVTCLGTGQAHVFCPYCSKDGADYADPDDNGRPVHRACVEEGRCVECGGPLDSIMTPLRYCEATSMRCGRCVWEIDAEDAALRGVGL